MTCYSKKILDLFYNINNSGRIIKPEAIGRAGSKLEGTVIEFSWRVKDGRIEDARFRTFGDVNAIVISSVLTSMMTGRDVEDVLTIKAEDVLEQVQDDKPNYLYLTDLALSALTSTYENYTKRMAKSDKVQVKKHNEFANQLKDDLLKLENGEDLANLYDNYNLSDVNIDETTDEEQYLNNVKEYEKTINDNSVETSLKSILAGESDFFSFEKTENNPKSVGRGRPRRERTPEELEAEANKVVRGRGRPRKERTVEELEAEANRVKRGRGRPKKEKTEEELEAEANKVLRGRGRPRRERTPEELEAEANKVIRGRGRPRKELSTETIEQDIDAIGVADNTENNEESRRRGRPRKEKTEEELIAEESKVIRGRGRPRKERTLEGSEVEVNKVVRGRGRPRKNSIFAVQKVENRIDENANELNNDAIATDVTVAKSDYINEGTISNYYDEEGLTEVAQQQNILRGRGRPRRERTPEELEAEANKIIRGRGRPKKEKTAEELEAEANKVVRGRGRPRKVVDDNINEEQNGINDINTNLGYSDNLNTNTEINNEIYNENNVESLEDTSSDNTDVSNDNIDQYINSIKNIFMNNTHKSTEEDGEIKRRGRPRKEVDESQEVATEVRGRGRPRKERSPEELEAEANKVIRGRGRPKKEKTEDELEAEANKVIRGRGRPKKEKTAEELEAEANKIVRGRGRPKKDETIPQSLSNNNTLTEDKLHNNVNNYTVASAVEYKSTADIAKENIRPNANSYVASNSTNNFNQVADSIIEDEDNNSTRVEEYSFTTNSFAPAQNKYGVGIKPNSSYPIRTVTIKKTTATPSNEEHSAVRAEKKPNNEIQEIEGRSSKVEELSAGEKAMARLNELKSNTQNTANEIKTEKVLDDEESKERVPLSENINNILSSGGSIEDALKALMED